MKKEEVLAVFLAVVVLGVSLWHATTRIKLNEAEQQIEQLKASARKATLDSGRAGFVAGCLFTTPPDDPMFPLYREICTQYSIKFVQMIETK